MDVTIIKLQWVINPSHTCAYHADVGVFQNKLYIFFNDYALVKQQ